jgi:HlyD family type I secretion membrane fusion protein
MPAELTERGATSYVEAIIAGQIRQFETRRAALEGQRLVIGEKILQLQSQIDGAEAQIKAFADQRESIRAESESLSPLVEKSLIPRARVLQLERSAYGLDGQIADTRANTARLRQAIAEQHLQITQLGNERMAEITRELREIQAKLAEVVPRRISAEAALSRMEIRAPYDGRVVALTVFSIGGVIQRGEKILDIVPDDDTLTIEVQVPAEDVSDLQPGVRAEFHPTAFKQRALPAIHGEIVSISADRLTDQRSGGTYFLASIRPDADAHDMRVRLHPGMPGTVFIPTGARTALDYLVGPLTVSFRKAFR